MAKADAGSILGKDAELLARIRARVADGYAADVENREAALDDLKFASGEQWPELVKKQRESDGRPCLTLNRTGQFVRQVTGDVRLNKPAIKVSPVEDADKQSADVIEGLIRHIEDSCRAGNVYVMASEDAVRCGVGYFRVNREYCGDGSFDQDIIVQPIKNAFSVIMDPMMLEQTGRDARWCVVYDEMLKEDFQKEYPKASLTSATLPDGGSTTADEVSWWQTAEKIKVAEYWEVQREEYEIIQLGDGSVVKADEFKSGMQEVARRKTHRNKVVMWLTNGTDILDGPVEFQARRIPIIRVVGEEIRIGPRIVRHGLIRFLKDSQRMENYWRSAMVERAALAPKAPWLATGKMLAGHESEWVNSATGNPNVLIYSIDPAAPGMRPDRIQPAPVEPAMMQQSVLASDDMKAISGIYDASLGARSNETSGKAIEARKREGDVGTFVYIDNLSNAISEAGRIMVDLIPVTYDARKQIRILGQDSQAAVVAVNQPGAVDLTRGKYDVTVSTGPSFGTRREEARQSMTEFIQAFPMAAPVLGDLIAKNSDWPYAEEVAERLAPIARASMPPDPSQPPPPDPAMVAAQAKAEGDQMKFQADMALKQIDVQAAQQQMEFERMKLDADLRKAEIDAQLKQLELQARLQEMNMQLELGRGQLANAEAERRARGEERMAGERAASMKPQDTPDALPRALEAIAMSNGALAQAITAPKTIMRGPDGRATGLQAG